MTVSNNLAVLSALPVASRFPSGEPCPFFSCFHKCISYAGRSSSDPATKSL